MQELCMNFFVELDRGKMPVLGWHSLPMRVKKLQYILLFGVGVIVVFTLILTRNYFKTNTAHGDTTQNLVVYADQLSGQVALQETSGNAGPATFVDSIQFIANQPTPTSPPSNSSGANQTASIYADSLASGWGNWSWNSNISFNVTNPVYQGSVAISFIP